MHQDLDCDCFTCEEIYPWDKAMRKCFCQHMDLKRHSIQTKAVQCCILKGSCEGLRLGFASQVGREQSQPAHRPFCAFPTAFTLFSVLFEQTTLCLLKMRSAYAGNESPARAESSVGAISHQQNAETFTDGAESRPLQSVGDHSVGVSFADNTLRTSVNSVSAAVGDSVDETTAEIVTSTPIVAPNQGEEVSRPTDDQIIAQENSIRCLIFTHRTWSPVLSMPVFTTLGDWPALHAFCKSHLYLTCTVRAPCDGGFTANAGLLRRRR